MNDGFGFFYLSVVAVFCWSLREWTPNTIVLSKRERERERERKVLYTKNSCESIIDYYREFEYVKRKKKKKKNFLFSHHQLREMTVIAAN